MFETFPAYIHILIHINRLAEDRRPTPGISGERQHNVHKGNAEARVRCMPLLGTVLSCTKRGGSADLIGS